MALWRTPGIRGLPSDMLEARSYREVLSGYLRHAVEALRECDEMFGARA